MVQFGKTEIFSKFQIGAIAHPGVITGFPVKVKEFLESYRKYCHILSFSLPLPISPSASPPHSPRQGPGCHSHGHTISLTVSFGDHEGPGSLETILLLLTCVSQTYRLWQMVLLRETWIREELSCVKHGWDDGHHVGCDYIKARN